MQQASQIVQRPIGQLQYLDPLVDELTHLVQLPLALGQVLDLLGRHRRGEPRLAAVEQHHAVVERLNALVAYDERLQLELAGLVEGYGSQPAHRRPHLVLAADALLDHLLLEADGLAGQLVGRRHLAAQGVERVQQPDRERGGGAEPRARGQVAHVLDLYPVGKFAGVFHQGRTNRGVHQLAMVAYQLDLRVDHAMLVGEEWRQFAHEDVAVLVDGRAEHGTAVLLVPGGVVGAAAEQ